MDIAAMMAPIPNSTSALMASIFPRVKRESVLSTSTPFLMSVLMLSLVLLDSAPTYAPPPRNTSATMPVVMASPRGGRGLHRHRVLRRRRGRNANLLLQRRPPERLLKDGVLARLQLLRVGRAADGTDVLAVDVEIGADDVGGDLDPPQVVLFRKRDV